MTRAKKGIGRGGLPPRKTRLSKVAGRKAAKAANQTTKRRAWNDDLR